MQCEAIDDRVIALDTTVLNAQGPFRQRTLSCHRTRAMRRALAGLIVLTPVAAWAGPPAAPIPTPEQAGFNALVAEVTTAQRALAIANANIAALSATIGRERAYWAAWSAGVVAKTSPGVHNVTLPKATGVKHGTP